MGAVQLPDELERAIDQQVAAGRAASASAFLEEAVTRLIDDARAEEDEIVAAAKAGIADMEGGRYVTVTNLEDTQRLYDRLMTRTRESRSTGK